MSGDDLRRVLLRLELLTASQLYRAVADHVGLDFVDLTEHASTPPPSG